MQMTWTMLLIVCPLVFLSGLVDAIGGGGGLISLPAYIFAGVPMYNAVATNKLSSAIGTTVSTVRYCRHTKVDFRLAVPAVIFSLIGAAAGAHMTLLIDEEVLKHMMLVVLPVAAFFVLRKNAFTVRKGEEISRRRELVISWAGAFFVGAYDGFYGPGTGTFMLIIFISFAKQSAMEAALNTKLVNLTSNVTALVTFLISGKVLIVLGLIAAVFSVAGHYIGASLVLKNGEKIVKPLILVVLAMLLVKVVTSI